MQCPVCGLANSETALRCECGYDLAKKQMKEPYHELYNTTPLPDSERHGCFARLGLP